MTRIAARLWTCLVPLMMAACGRGAEQAPPQTPAVAEQGEAPASEQYAADGAPGYGYPTAPSQAQPGPPPAPSASPSSNAAAKSSVLSEAQEDEDRPGLATEWGETRVSQVTSAPFVRASMSPTVFASLFYNNESGARAMLGGAVWSWERGFIGLAGHAIEVGVVDESGQPYPSVRAGDRNVIIGEQGRRYAITLRNRTAGRLEAVVTVDGLDVIDGEAGAYTKRGYLLAPYGALTIDGYRRSMDEVAAFRFGSVGASYAARKGDSRNVGVIGIALFEENGYPFPWTPGEVERRRQADPFPGQFAQPPRRGW
ncbi:MAG: hypothetical protein JW940_12825 [Polyangiaceae bacterium]|nr:hypothetical protein [Polyangiaceae bacterium]